MLINGLTAALSNSIGDARCPGVRFAARDAPGRVARRLRPRAPLKPSPQPRLSPRQGAQARPAPPPLLPRRLLFGDPERIARTRSAQTADGFAISPPRDGVLNICVAPSNDPDAAQPVTNETASASIRFFSFAYTDDHMLYRQHIGGDEKLQLYVDQPHERRREGTDAERRACRRRGAVAEAPG